VSEHAGFISLEHIRLGAPEEVLADLIWVVLWPSLEN
jgi:hypothetical protein